MEPNEKRPLLQDDSDTEGTSYGSTSKKHSSKSSLPLPERKLKTDTAKKHKRPFSSLFRYATWHDHLLMFLGSIFSIIHGAGFPFLSIIFGGMTNSLLGRQINLSPPSGFTAAYRNPDNESLPSPGATMGPDVTIFSNPVDSLFGPEFLAEMTQYSLYYTYVGIAMFVASYGQIACWATSCERQIYKLRQAFFKAILRQQIQWYDEHQSGELTSKLADDLERIREGIGDKCSMFAQFVSAFFAGFIIGFIYNWQLTLVMMALTPILAASAAFMAGSMAASTKREQQKYAVAGAIAEEVLGCIRTVVAFNGQNREIARYEAALADGRTIAVRKYLYMGLGLSVMFLAMYCSYGLAFWYGSKLLERHPDFSAGTVFTVFFSVMTGSFSLGNAAPHFSTIATAKGAMSNILDIVDTRPVIDPYSDEGDRPYNINSRIEINNVHFSYPARKDVKILRGVSLTVDPGKTVALVGSSGCGKSTVVNLLLRYYDTNSGQILIGGHDLKSLNVRYLRQLIGVVSQEPILFDGTIEENIRYGKRDVTMTDIFTACRMSNAHDFIMKLPQGYSTRVGERGAQLSGGQKQRIAIARALVRDPRILLLDEATSALDAESEGIVQQALEKAQEGRTTIVIAHRLSTIQNADQIVAFKEGQIAETGTHHELMAKRGLYHQLVMAQLFEESEDKELVSEEEGRESDDSGTGAEDMYARRQHSRFGRLRKQSSGALSHRSSASNASRSSAARKKSSMLTRGGVSVEKRIKTEIEEEHFPEVSLTQIAKENKPYWGSAALGFLGAAINGAIMPTFAMFYSQIFDVYSKKGKELEEGAIFWGIMFVVLGVLQAIAYMLTMYFFARSAEFMTMTLRVKVFKNILRQDVAYFDDDRHATGKITTRLASDAPTVRNAVGSRISFILSAFIAMIAGVVIAFIFGWKLALVICAMLPVLVFANYLDMRLQMSNQHRDALLLEEAGRVAAEGIENIRTVQALTQEETFYTNFAQHLKVPHKEAMKQAQVYAISFGFAQSVIFFMYAASFRFGAYLMEVDHMLPLDVYRVFFAISFCGVTVGQATSFIPDYTKGRLSARLIFGMMRYQPRIDSYSVAGLKPEIRGTVTFKDVHFAYPTRATVRVFRGMDFSVQPGKTVALVGPSGCGKSTVVGLLERFYDPMHGQILVDDYDIRTVNLGYLRDNISVVSQEPVLFNCSIEDNIVYGVEGKISHAEVVDAAKLANIHEFIMTLPEGYNTYVGERGTQLSGGQKQRIAIARALVHNPRILLLDEATSALDTESEKVVQEALDRAREGRTCIMIAHRLSTVQGADIIMVIKDGKVAEKGSHAELMAKKGAYYNLVRRQNLQEEK